MKECLINYCFRIAYGSQDYCNLHHEHWKQSERLFKSGVSMEKKKVDPLRRIYVEKQYEAEKAIRSAMKEVERMGAHPVLTQAVMKLNEAKDLVGDWIDWNLYGLPDINNR